MNFYQHWTKRLIYTEGVFHHAEEHGAHWLIDAIANYQGRIEHLDDRLRDFQLWILVVRNKRATLFCWADSGPDEKKYVKQLIEYTDHPEGTFKFYVELGEQMTLMLPEER